MRKLIYLFCLPVMLLVASCTKQIPDYGATSTVKMANGWWVVLSLGGAPQTSQVFMTTYNTSANTTDSLWIDDLKNGYGFKCKAKIDYTNMTFAATNSANDYYVGTPAFPATVSITGGKVLAKAGHSKSGVATDSIYMKVVFSDDPTDTWEIAGTARTGLIEDDY